MWTVRSRELSTRPTTETTSQTTRRVTTPAPRRSQERLLFSWKRVLTRVAYFLKAAEWHSRAISLMSPGEYGAALTEYEQLPPAAQSAGADFIDGVRARHEIDTLVEEALTRAKDATGPFAVVIDTDPYSTSPNGDLWWEVAIPEVSTRPTVNAAREKYETALKARDSDAM